MGNYVDCDKDSSVLREYFLAGRRSRERFADAHAFDAFFRDVEKMLSLRVRAEDIFSKNRHLAKHSRGPLPLTAAQIRETLGNADGAPVRIIVRAARACEIPLTEIRKNFRRILARERCRIPIAKVTELDSACMIWQSRQPGNTLGEKAGSRQRILSVVKVENFNTLENRVLKDFLIRAERLCDDYLAEFGDEKTTHDVNVERVRGFQRRCKSVLQENALAGIPENRGGLPTPNYVLQQNPHYSQIWKFYKEFISLTQLLETLWESRAELQETLKKLAEYSAPVPAKSGDVLWFRKIDDWRRNSAGNTSERFLENPFWENKFPAAHGKALPAGTPSETAKARIVDLATGTVCLPTADARRIQRNLLVYPLSRHGNAKPYLQDFEHPRNENFSLGGKLVDVNEIFSAPDNFSFDRRFPEPNAERISEYFEQLDGICAEIDGNARRSAEWIILVPDEWSQFMQEALIQKVPAPRENVRLLWRSVAAALGDPEKMRGNGAREGTQFFVAETGADGFSRETRLFRKKNQHGNIVPKRRAFATHHSSDKRRTASNDFWVNAAEICNGYPCRMRFYYGKRTTYRGNDGDFTTEQLLAGARRFEEMRSRGEIPYYDELDALNLVIQRRNEEEVVFKTIVEGTDCEGGKEYVSEEISDFAKIQAKSTFVKFCLRAGALGPNHGANDPLKEKTKDFGKSENLAKSLSDGEEIPFSVQARCTPGQGLARITIRNASLNFSETIDLLDMQDAFVTEKSAAGNVVRKLDGNGNPIPLTRAFLESQIERSFPPNLPLVETDTNWWKNSEKTNRLKAYLSGRGTLPGNFFYGNTNPQSPEGRPSPLKFPSWVPFPENLPPTARLIRLSIIGHDFFEAVPEEIFSKSEKDRLLKKLADDFWNAKTVRQQDTFVQLIAWTYQTDFRAFKGVRDAVRNGLIASFRDGNDMPPPQHFTLCGNLSSRADEIRILYKDLIFPCMEGTPNNTGSTGEILRMFSYLIQYNSDFIKFSKCAETREQADALTKRLLYWLNFFHKRWQQQHSNTIIRCLLFLLRLRKKFRSFMRQGEDPLYDEAKTEIETKLNTLPATAASIPLYKSVLAYLDGKGTLDGIPIN